MTASRRSVIFTAPASIDVISEEIPPPDSGQILVQTIVSSVSAGTEMLFYRGQVPAGLAVDSSISQLSGAVEYPLRYGYACVGRVVDLGPGVAANWLDKIVFAFQPHTSHFVIDVDDALQVPNSSSLEIASLLPNMETAVNFVMDGQPLIGETAIVFGQGIVGLLTTTLLAKFPLAQLVSVDAYPMRRNASVAIGASASYAPDEIESSIDGQNFDLSYELSGQPAALDQAIQVTGFGGRIVVGSWYGTKQANINLGGTFHRSRIQLISSQVSTIAPRFLGRWDKERRLTIAMQMLETIDADRLITHRFPVEEAATAYRLIDRQSQEVIQVLLRY